MRKRDEEQVLDSLLNDVRDDTRLTRVDVQSGDMGKAFADALAQAEDISSRFTDRKMKVGDTRVELTDKGVPFLHDRRRDEALWFSPWAFAQFGDKLGMGATQYMKKCLKEGQPDLVPLNMNRWIEKNQEKELLVRLYDDDLMKGILSNKYAPLNHNEVLNGLGHVLSGGQYALESYVVTPDNMQLRLVDPEKVIVQRENQNGSDRSTAGMLIRNGMTGMSSVSIEFLIFTFVCTNGMVVGFDKGMVYNRKHYAIGREQFIQEVVKTFGGFPEYVVAARENIEKARQTRLDIEQRVELFELIKKELRCGNEMLDKIKATMENSWGRTAWGLPGAITEVAQELPSERQYEFERFAGTLMQRLVA